MKDCRTCKYGYEDEQLGIPMCHHPERFSEDCVDFNMHEEKEIKKSEIPTNLDLEEDALMYCFDNGINLSAKVAGEFARHFYELGETRMKEQMMKEAVEGFIFQSEDYYPKEIVGRYEGELKHGDKVKLIIIRP